MVGRNWTITSAQWVYQKAPSTYQMDWQNLYAALVMVPLHADPNDADAAVRTFHARIFVPVLEETGVTINIEFHALNKYILLIINQFIVAYYNKLNYVKLSKKVFLFLIFSIGRGRVDYVLIE